MKTAKDIKDEVANNTVDLLMNIGKLNVERHNAMKAQFDITILEENDIIHKRGWDPIALNQRHVMMTFDEYIKFQNLIDKLK